MEDFWCRQEWQTLNRRYIPFRLFIYAYLRLPTVSLKELFDGAKVNIPVDIGTKIPPWASLKVCRIDYRFPSTQAPAFEIGDNVLNARGAPFDSFMYLETAVACIPDKCAPSALSVTRSNRWTLDLGESRKPLQNIYLEPTSWALFRVTV